jgi:putative phage-type endonuclease
LKYRVVAKNVQSMSRAEWLDIRRKGIGGSDAAAICGVNPWRGPLSVYLSKIGEAPDADANEAMEWGTELEDTIAKVFSRRTQQKVKRCNMILQHNDYDFMLANVDRFTLDDEEGEWGVLEVKNVGEYRREDWADGAVPEYYEIQGQHYMAVTGANYVWFAPLIGGNKMQPVKVMRSERAITSLIKIERDFWHLVETRTPPPIDDSVEATKVLKALYPRSEKTSVVLDSKLVENLRRLRDQKSDLERELRGLENQIKLQMAEAEEAYIPGAEKPVITWKGGTVPIFQEKLFKAEHPELAQKYMKETSTRRFLPK